MNNLLYTCRTNIWDVAKQRCSISDSLALPSPMKLTAVGDVFFEIANQEQFAVLRKLFWSGNVKRGLLMILGELDLLPCFGS